MIESLDESLNSSQIDKLTKLLNAKKLSDKYKINDRKQKVFFTNNLAIIGITSDESVIKTYSNYNLNIIDLTAVSNLQSPAFIPGLLNWVRLPWTLYGISLLEEKQSDDKPEKPVAFAENFFNEFVKKYINVQTIEDDTIQKKKAYKENNFTYKSDLYNYYKGLFSSMYPAVEIEYKQNSLTKRLINCFPGLINYRPHTSSNGENNSGFLGLVLNKQRIECDINYYNNLLSQNGNVATTVTIQSCVDQNFLELLNKCEELVPDDLKDIVCDKSNLKVTIKQREGN